MRTRIQRVLPYFRGTAVTCSSHSQTPPVTEPDRFPALLPGERCFYFADPIFREYQQTGNLAVRQAWRQVM